MEKQSSIYYSVLQMLLNKVVQSNGQNKETIVSKKELMSLLNLAESESEKERLKYLAVRSSGISAHKAQKIYGFHNGHNRAVSLGVSDANSVSEDEISESGDDTDHQQDEGGDEGDVNAGGKFPHQFELSKYINDGECYEHVTETDDISMNSHQLQVILKKCSFNWFTFVDVDKEMLHDFKP